PSPLSLPDALPIYRSKRVPLEMLPEGSAWEWVRARATTAGPRAEAFALEFEDGRVLPAWCELDAQYVGPEAITADPDLAHALACWVFARGGRHQNLRHPNGELVAAAPLSARNLSTPGLSDAHRSQRLITLCPSNAEMVHALGAFERVVACEESSDYPPAV